MAHTAAELALARALAWVEWSGLPPAPDATRLILQILEREIAAGEDRLVERTMDALYQRANTPDPLLPPAVPPIRRTSIGYPPYR